MIGLGVNAEAPKACGCGVVTGILRGYCRRAGEQHPVASVFDNILGPVSHVGNCQHYTEKHKGVSQTSYLVTSSNSKSYAVSEITKYLLYTS